MFEKVNKSHPDKIADRIAGFIVDMSYIKNKSPKIAVEVLIGHDNCLIIIETSEVFSDYDKMLIKNKVFDLVNKQISVDIVVEKQDPILESNQINQISAGDNGIFYGYPITDEEKRLSAIVNEIYKYYPSDGKYIINNNDLIICQSNAKNEDLLKIVDKYKFDNIIINPLGEWSGGTDVDSGATNRKLGSDMGRSVSGGGLHGKDLSKGDVTLNIYAFLKAQELNEDVKLCCAIGDKQIDGKSYSEIVELAYNYIKTIGGFEKFAESGLIR